jgi:hypothetical protein
VNVVETGLNWRFYLPISVVPKVLTGVTANYDVQFNHRHVFHTSSGGLEWVW